MRWAGHVARVEEDSSFKIITGTPTGKRPLGKPRRIWDDTFRINILYIYIYIYISIRGIGLVLFRIGIVGEPLGMRH